jgi:hypothetical protein
MAETGRKSFQASLGKKQSKGDPSKVSASPNLQNKEKQEDWGHTAQVMEDLL